MSYHSLAWALSNHSIVVIVELAVSACDLDVLVMGIDRLVRAFAIMFSPRPIGVFFSTAILAVSPPSVGFRIVKPPGIVFSVLRLDLDLFLSLFLTFCLLLLRVGKGSSGVAGAWRQALCSFVFLVAVPLF